MRKKHVHLKSLEGKSKSEKKKIREEYEKVQKRLEKSQAKYLGTFKNEGKYKKGKNASKGKVSMRTERQKRWLGWDRQEEAGEVVTYHISELKDNKN